MYRFLPLEIGNYNCRQSGIIIVANQTGLQLPEDPCGGCSECAGSCPKRFDVEARITDVTRLAKVPLEFLS